MCFGCLAEAAKDPCVSPCSSKTPMLSTDQDAPPAPSSGTWLFKLGLKHVTHKNSTSSGLALNVRILMAVATTTAASVATLSVAIKMSEDDAMVDTVPWILYHGVIVCICSMTRCCCTLAYDVVKPCHTCLGMIAPLGSGLGVGNDGPRTPQPTLWRH
jgi:hypothetical protein